MKVGKFVSIKLFAHDFIQLLWVLLSDAAGKTPLICLYFFFLLKVCIEEIA